MAVSRAISGEGVLRKLLFQKELIRGAIRLQKGERDTL